MSDIVSNALNRGLDQDELKVRAFLDEVSGKYSTGQELLKAAAVKFEVKESVLAAEVEKYRHCNCEHGDGGEGQAQAASVEAVVRGDSQFARDVTVHVVLHEYGHALIREFDLPVFGNEETAADAFATYFVATYLPERALDVLKARTTSLMIEAREVPRAEWSVSGEHNSDARRAFQIAAIAIAVDPAKFNSVATELGMSEREIRSAKDYGAEVCRSWRRALKPLWMPDGVASGEARVRLEPDSEFFKQLCSDGLAQELLSVLQRFDWHSQVTLQFAEGEGGAGWSRSKRTITVRSEYVLRFVEQGKRAK